MISMIWVLRGIAALAFVAASVRGSVEKPNFIIILTDDQGYQDLGCFGSPNIKTPHIDRMAAEGIRFTDFYVSGPKCVPSRFSLMTGCYPPKVDSPLPLYYGSPFGINDKEILISELLQENGYATSLIGKWHLGSRPSFHPNRHGFDYYYGILSSNDHRKNKPLLFRQETVIEDPANQATLTKRFTEEAIRFIENKKTESFFLYLAYAMPHKPLHVSEDFKGTSERGLYGDTIEEIDWSTGQILETLKRLDLDKKTLVVFYSDNGPWLTLGDHGGSALPLRDGKLSTYEGGVRVPFIAWGPGFFAGGTTCDEVAICMDIYPTLAAMAGIPVPESQMVDGKSLLELFEDPEKAKAPHEFILYYKEKQLIAIRKGKWKYHWPSLFTDEFHKDGELYDLETDIGESNNLIRIHQDIANELRKLGEGAHQSMNRDYRPGARSEDPPYRW
jgi:arylsulfatase A